MTDERLDEIKTKWNIPVTLPMSVPWGKDDVVWLVQEVERLRAKVRTITEHYKPGWVDGLKAVARNAGFDPDDVPHDGVDPPTFIEDVIDLLRRDVRDLKAENERLCEALADIARGDYSDPLCQRTPEQRAREALAGRKKKS
jgi:hypothetical protein